MQVRNPILPGFHPDPSICRVGDDYYLVTSSFAYVPGVPIFHSRDLVNWRQIGYCLTRPSQLPLEGTRVSGGIYAPTIRYHNGVFYMITTNVDVTTTGMRASGNFIVWTRDPAGEWSEPLWLDQTDIDPSLFFDADGQVYMTSTYMPPEGLSSDLTRLGWGIQQSTLDLETGAFIQPPRMIWRGTGGSWPEAPHLYKRDGVYYLMIAEGGTSYGHMETIARADNPWGPWEPCPRNPILSHRSLHDPIQATGHADLVEAQDGSWWLVCLGVRPHPGMGLHHLGRETFLAPVVWDAAGWPVVGQGGRIALTLEAPRLPSAPWPAPALRDDFDQPELDMGWNFVHWPDPEQWSLTERSGYLRLRGGPDRLSDPRGVMFVGRRQQHVCCSATTQLEFAPDAAGQEAGLVVWMDQRHHYALAVVLEDGQRHVVVRQRIGTLEGVVARAPLGAGPVTLQVQVDPQTTMADAKIPPYVFGWACGSDELHELARADARYLTSEVAGGFTGVYFGLYATNTGANPADFAWFEYQALAE